MCNGKINLILLATTVTKMLDHNNVVYEKAVDKNGENPCITTYQYDSLGRLSKAVCNGHSYEYTYNEEGLLKEKRSSGKLLTSYEYDKAGKTTKMTDQAGVSTCYEYDILGRTTRLYTEQGMEVDYTYDCLNRIEQIGYGNGIITRYLYDENGNISTLETRGKENTLLFFTYAYDGNGNRISKTGEQSLVSGGTEMFATTYQYNVRGQLTKETQGEDTLHYTYDPSGNRIKKESKEGSIFYGYNEKNQLICEEGIHGKGVFTYSRQGSILKEEAQAGTRKFFYNSKNQQIRVDLEDKRVQENRYDANGLRFEMKENEKLLRFAYHKGEIYFENSENSQTSYHLGAGIEGFTRDQKSSYLHQDEQLSTALVTDGGGAVQNHYLYGAFGEARESAEQTPNRIRYTGQQYDGVTGQYYLRARFYYPILGRFMQEDVYLGDGLNLYAYCDSNPVMYYDPSGYAKKRGGCPPGARFPQDPNALFPDNYPGMTKTVQPDGKIIYDVEAGGKNYKVEFHPNHGGSDHFDGDHYHVKKEAEFSKPGKQTKPFFRLPNLDPDTHAQGGTFAPGDLLPTQNRK